MYDIFGHDYVASKLEINNDQNVITKDESELRIIYIFIIGAFLSLLICFISFTLLLLKHHENMKGIHIKL